MSNNVETNKKPRRLGRGLGSLLGDHLEADLDSNLETKPSAKKTAAKPAPRPVQKIEVNVPDTERILKVSVDKVHPNPNQPRRHFDAKKLEELAASIKEQGILQPVVVRKDQEGYTIISGERRWRAAQKAGQLEIPVILKDGTEQKVLELALIENIQRHDLNPVEEAEAYQRLIEEYDLTQGDVAKKVGKDRATVANLVRLLGLPLEVRDMVAKSEITLGHAKVILAVEDPVKAKGLARQIQKDGLSVRATEKLIKQGQKATSKAEAPSLDLDVSKKLAATLADDLQKTLGTKVEIQYNQGKGKLSIRFYSDDELTQLVEKLKKS